MSASTDDSSRRVSGKRAKGNARARETGWDVKTDEGGDDILPRIVIFIILVGAIGCLGVWIVLTSQVDGSDAPILSATHGTGGELNYTVVLLPQVEPAQRSSVDRIIATEQMQELSGQHEFRFVELVNGGFALCVGRAPGRNAPELRQLLRRFRNFETPSGGKPFEAASIQGCRE